MAVLTSKPNEDNGDDNGKVVALEDELVIKDKDGNKMHFAPLTTENQK